MNNKLKNIIKGIYYSAPCRMARKYPSKIQFLKRCRSAVRERKIEQTKHAKIRAVFLLEVPEMWNACRSVYEAMLSMENVEPYLIVLPKYPNIDDYPALDFSRSIAGNVIQAYDPLTKKWFNLEKFKPDYLFYSRPYAKEYPDFYKPHCTSKYTRICYIPYGFEFIKGYHIEVEYNMDFFPYAYMLFFEGETSRSYCDFYCKGLDQVKMFEIGYPKFDLSYYKKMELQREKNRTTFLWTPRWSLETLANDGTSYFELIEPLIAYFSNPMHSALNLIIRPHPLMFPNFVKNGVMTQQDVDSLFEKIEKIPNISFDKNIDYLESLSISDYVISDFTSMLIEYLLFEIPVLYCGKSDKFDKVGQLIDSTMYHFSDYDDISMALDSFIKDGDKHEKKRKKALDYLCKGFDGKIGDRIAKTIVDDYYD